MILLHDVLKAVESTKGSITLMELSRRLNIAPEVLDGMLQHWERKGRLVIDEGAAEACSMSCATECGCGAGSGIVGCPFNVRLPRSYTLAKKA